MMRSFCHWLVTGLVIGTLFVLGGVTPSWAQNAFPPSGNAGIGTLSPQAKMHIVGGNRNFLLLDGSNPSIQTIMEFINGPTTWVVGNHDGFSNYTDFGVRNQTNRINALNITAAGHVGIQTVSPERPLHVVGSNKNVARFEASGGLAQTFIEFVTDDKTWQIGDHDGFSAWNGWGVRNATDGINAFNITANGYVGIGTATPAAMLHVTGDVRVDGNIAAKYQDVAEWVRTSLTLSPGTVVTIDTQDPHRVVTSSTPYDTRVAGVVSQQPGIVLGEPGADKAMIAHSGRVSVKVDTSYGSIAAGDLLVTSPTPGYAMRSEPVSIGGTAMHRPGTLVGKALEPLSEGQGEILVLLTLQ